MEADDQAFSVAGGNEQGSLAVPNYAVNAVCVLTPHVRHPQRSSWPCLETSLFDLCRAQATARQFLGVAHAELKRGEKLLEACVEAAQRCSLGGNGERLQTLWRAVLNECIHPLGAKLSEGMGSVFRLVLCAHADRHGFMSVILWCGRNPDG